MEIMVLRDMIKHKLAMSHECYETVLNVFNYTSHMNKFCCLNIIPLK